MADDSLSLPQGTLDLLSLKTLASGSRHGYGVARWLEETTDDVLSVQEGALYPALYRMERRGWIKAEWSQSEIGKDIKVYSLTDRKSVVEGERVEREGRGTT